MVIPEFAMAKSPVVILLSSDEGPFRQSAGGAIDALGKSKARIIVLDKDPENIFHSMKKVSLISPPVVIAIGNQAALALQTYPIEAPIVFSLIVDHRKALTIPNSYAISMHLSPEDAYSNILQILPGSRIGVPYNPERTGFLIDDLAQFFKNKKTKMVPIPINLPSEMGPALKAMRSEFDAIWILPDPSIIHPLSLEYLMEYSIRERIPVLGYSKAFTKAGAIFSISSSYEDMGRQAALLSKKILNGDKAEKLYYPERIHRFINIRVAKLLNITIPNQLFASIDQVYPIEPRLR